MTAVQVPEAGADFAVVEVPVPDPGPAQVRIEVAACGVCGGDELPRTGGPMVDYPRIPGHEIIGRIDAVGADVAAWDRGERVGVGWYGGHCFDCGPCRRGQFTACADAHITGAAGDGGYAEYTVANAEALIPVPESLDATAAPLTCAGLTAYNALRHTDAAASDLVAVQGIGGVGHMGLQYAAAMGYETVALSRGTDKREAALDLGADRFVDTTDVAADEVLQSLGGADVILGTAPSSDAIEGAVGGLAHGGEFVALAPPHEAVELPVGSFVNDRLSFRGWSSGHAGDAADALAFSADRGIEPLTETYDLPEAEAAYSDMLAGDVRFRAVLVP